MIEIVKLDSGIRLVLERIPYVESVAAGVWVKAGAVNEDKKYAGISHFVEHMMFKGTESRSAKKIAEDIDRIGGQINAFTGKEATCYYVKSVSDCYEQALDVLVDMLSNSVLDRNEMNKERKVICEEIKMTLDTPDDLAHETIISMVFKGNPLGNSIIGTPTSLHRITHNVMKNYFDNNYTRDSIVVSIAGNFDREKICEYFNDKFMSLKKNRNEKKEKLLPYVPSYKSVTKDIEQTHICLATKSLSLDDPEYYAFSILNNIMGGSMSSRLFQNIREEKGLAYSVYSMFGPFSYDGYFNIYAGVSHDKIEAATDGIRNELELLAENGISAEELESSRAQMKSGFVFGQENVSGRMFKNGKNLVLLDRVFSQEEIIKGYDEVSIEDIDIIRKKICDFSRYSAVTVSNRKTDIKRIMRG